MSTAYFGQTHINQNITAWKLIPKSWFSVRSALDMVQEPPNLVQQGTIDISAGGPNSVICIRHFGPKPLWMSHTGTTKFLISQGPSLIPILLKSLGSCQSKIHNTTLHRIFVTSCWLLKLSFTTSSPVDSNCIQSLEFFLRVIYIVY